jgi:hypothetical protein
MHLPFATAGAAQWRVDAIIGHTFTNYEVTAPTPFPGVETITYQQREDLPPFAIGGRLTRVMREQWDIQLGVTLDKADLLVTQDDGSGLPAVERRSGRVLYADVRGIRRLGKAGRKVGFNVGLGPALSWRMGDAYEGSSGTRSIGVAFGAGARIRLNRISLRFDIEDHLYRLDLVDASGARFPRKTQNDVLLSIGVGLYTSRAPSLAAGRRTPRP